MYLFIYLLPAWEEGQGNPPESRVHFPYYSNIAEN